MDSIIKVLQNPRCAVMPDRPASRPFSPLTRSTSRPPILNNFAYVRGSPRIYTSSPPAGRAHARITVIVDTLSIPENYFTINSMPMSRTAS